MTAKNLQDDIDKDDLTATTGNIQNLHFTEIRVVCKSVEPLYIVTFLTLLYPFNYSWN